MIGQNKSDYYHEGKTEELEICQEKEDMNTDSNIIDESVYLVEALDCEKTMKHIEPEFITLYEQALLNSLWDKGFLDQEEYEWCLQELRSRSE